MIDRFLNWLSSLSEAEKSLAVRPVGMSRRGFLGALGITAATSVGAILYTPPHVFTTTNYELLSFISSIAPVLQQQGIVFDMDTYTRCLSRYFEVPLQEIVQT
jgi:hypothetical protein